MLWIEYESTRRIEFCTVKEVVANIAKMVSPYPVAAFDLGIFGLGVVVSDTIFSAKPGTPVPVDLQMSAVEGDSLFEKQPPLLSSPTVSDARSDAATDGSFGYFEVDTKVGIEGINLAGASDSGTVDQIPDTNAS